MSTIVLNDQWQLTFEGLSWGPEMHSIVAGKQEGWLPANLPCDIHMPLIQAGLIKDPVIADYSFACEWTESRSWWFKRTFHIDEAFLNNERLELTMESLDAEADIFLNGSHLGHHKSAFYPYKQDVKKQLKQGANVLLVRVTSGVEYYSENEIAKVKDFVEADGNFNRGDKRRVFVRKAQYVFGWDWGPRVATCGIVGSVLLEAFSTAALRSVHVQTERVGGALAALRFDIEVENPHEYSTREGIVHVNLLSPGGKQITFSQPELLRSGINFIRIYIEVADAELWWPNGMGKPSLYTINVSVESGTVVARYREFKYGIRTVRLNLNPLREGERLFAIEVNGVRTYCKGGNWIPADSIYARVSDQKYETLLREAQAAHFNMLRVWGGGIYERDIFYEKCDEYGIMLWHDFMFACGMYPDNLAWFRDEVEEELDYQTRRLRNHACIVVWCGNNEISWAFDGYWPEKNPGPLFTGGAKIYNEIAPRIVHRNCPQIPYWNGSPYGGTNPNSNEIGTRHHWPDTLMNPDIERKITPEIYDDVTAKFISEYGHVGPCGKTTVTEYFGGQALDASSEIWRLHNNTFEKNTVKAGISKHYADASELSLDEYLLYGGLCQGLLLGYSLEAMRYKPECSGSLFWMYNDCWGEVGWTIIDYYLRRKISYQFVKRAFDPIKLIVRELDGRISVMGLNDTLDEVQFDVDYGYVSFDGQKADLRRKNIMLRPHSRECVLQWDKSSHSAVRGCWFIKPLDVRVLPAILRTDTFRSLEIGSAEVKVTDVRMNGSDLVCTVTSSSYAHAVHFQLDESLRLSDEYFDLLPGESRCVTIYGAAGLIGEDRLKPVSVSLPEFEKSLI